MELPDKALISHSELIKKMGKNRLRFILKKQFTADSRQQLVIFLNISI